MAFLFLCFRTTNEVCVSSRVLHDMSAAVRAWTPTHFSRTRIQIQHYLDAQDFGMACIRDACMYAMDERDASNGRDPESERQSMTTTASSSSTLQRHTRTYSAHHCWDQRLRQPMNISYDTILASTTDTRNVVHMFLYIHIRIHILYTQNATHIHD